MTSHAIANDMQKYPKVVMADNGIAFIMISVMQNFHYYQAQSRMKRVQITKDGLY